MGQIVSLPDATDRAWQAYAEHRALENYRPALVDDPDHIARSARLHARFMDLYSDEAPSAVVIPFRKKA